MGPAQADSAGAAESAWTSRRGGADDTYLRDRQAAENFPVALRALPRRYRVHLAAIYDVVRVIDDLGDEAPGDRTAQLEAFRADLSRIWHGGQPQAPVARRLAATVAACGLTEQPFTRLIAANLQDQSRTSYETWDDLMAYCDLSANPIGHLVLEVFGQFDARRAVRSDHVCTALQVIEHCQDVAEDHRAGRIYLPRQDLRRFGVTTADLSAPSASDSLRKTVATELDRCASLLDAGAPLVGDLRGWARLSVSGYAAGGIAAIDAIRDANFDVLSTHCHAKRSVIAKHLLKLLIRGRVSR